ncbi:MAG: AAA family ATPase [Planctomycetaceae bacterium]
MYESFYGLNKRPFAAAADVDATVETPAVADAIARLDRCLRQGRGIGVLTAPSGLGKTHLCHHLARHWEPEFQVTLLANAGFPSGRGLLQAMLAELDQPYQGLKETELRIELKSVAKTVRSQSAGLVLILDEAHRAVDRLLEEVRLLANLIEAGEPLVRIFLAGTIDLEDRLSDPALTGLNERVGELVTLPRLTATESRRYLAERSERAGGTLEDLFESCAIELILQACGGIPRCLNQLADHALLLGSVAGRTTVDAVLVREALDDLKRLPLQWQDPLPAAPAESTGAASREFDALDEPAENIIEIGELSDGSGLGGDIASTELEFDPAAESPSELASSRFDVPDDRFEADESVCETVFGEPAPPATEQIRDRFARLDADDAHRRWLEELKRGETECPGASSPPQLTVTKHEARRSSPQAANPLPVLDSVESLVAEELAIDRTTAAGSANVAGRVRLDRLVTALEASLDRLPSVGAKRPRQQESNHATLFRDLRRRDRATDRK